MLVEDGTPWIVMQLVVGTSLHNRLKEEPPVPSDEAATIARGLLAALKAAHAAGIVHRDIKPANVLLSDTGDVLLGDFGIAVHDTDTTLTVSGMFVGSLEYVAPERARGEDDNSASDLFSLGTTLYQTVSGTSPFRRSTPAATLTAILQDQPPPLTHAGTLKSLITELLEKDPDNRPTVDEALDMIDISPPLDASEADPPPTDEGSVIHVQAEDVCRKATRAAVKRAAHYGLDIVAIDGRGPDGLIVVDDVLQAHRGRLGHKDLRHVVRRSHDYPSNGWLWGVGIVIVAVISYVVVYGRDAKDHAHEGDCVRETGDGYTVQPCSLLVYGDNNYEVLARYDGYPTDDPGLCDRDLSSWTSTVHHVQMHWPSDRHGGGVILCLQHAPERSG